MYVSVRPSVGCRWAWAWTLHIGTTMRHIRAAWHGSRLEAQLYNTVDSPFDHWIDQKFSLQVFELHFFLSPSSLGWWTTFFSIGLQHHSCVCAFIDLPLFTNVHGIDTCVDVFKVMSSCGTNLCGRANERREGGKKRNGLIHTGAVWTYFVRWRWIGIRDTHIRYVDDVRCEMRWHEICCESAHNSVFGVSVKIRMTARFQFLIAINLMSWYGYYDGRPHTHTTSHWMNGWVYWAIQKLYNSIWIVCLIKRIQWFILTHTRTHARFLWFI